MTQDERNNVTMNLIELEEATSAFPVVAKRLGRLYRRATTTSSQHRVAKLIEQIHAEKCGATA